HRFRAHLLSLCDLTQFPPYTQFVRGYPAQLYESLISSIDADLMLYALTRRGTYNPRAISSQPCESLFGCLATLPGSKHGAPTASDIETSLAKVCGEMVLKVDKSKLVKLI